jgi:predicted anti-sigma-YlaC factor YlaD
MQTLACQRFRRLAALSVDEQPSQLEAVALARHLEQCRSCRSFAETVQSFTRDVRGAEFEAYRLPWASRPRQRRTDTLIRRALAGVAVACVVVFAGFAGAAFESFQSRSDVPRSLPALVIDASGADTARETQRFLQGLRDASLARTVGGPQDVERGRPGVRVG